MYPVQEKITEWVNFIILIHSFKRKRSPYVRLIEHNT